MCINIDNCLEIISAFGPVITGSMIVYIAGQQWKTSEKSRRTQQFQRYIDNYHKVMESISMIANGEQTQRNLASIKLREIRDEAQLFLSKEVLAYVEGVRKKYCHINMLRVQESDARAKGEDFEQFRSEAFDLEIQLGRENPYEIYRKSLHIDEPVSWWKKLTNCNQRIL